MLRIVTLVLSALILSSVANAQEGPITRGEARLLLGDVDALALYIRKEVVTSEDVRMVAAIGCSSMRIAMARRLPERIEPMIREMYPSPGELAEVSYEEFLQFEQQMLTSLEASERAGGLILVYLQETQGTFDDLPELPLDKVVLAIEDASCTLRSQPVIDQNAQAPIEERSAAEWIARCVVGLAVLTGDAFVTVETGGAAAAILGIVSGGWGWNRCEETYYKLFP